MSWPVNRPGEPGPWGGGMRSGPCPGCGHQHGSSWKRWRGGPYVLLTIGQCYACNCRLRVNLTKAG